MKCKVMTDKLRRDQTTTQTSIITHNCKRAIKYVRCALSVVHPVGYPETLIYRGDVIYAGVEMEHVEQVTCGPSHSASDGRRHKRQKQTG